MVDRYTLIGGSYEGNLYGLDLFQLPVSSLRAEEIKSYEELEGKEYIWRLLPAFVVSAHPQPVKCLGYNYNMRCLVSGSEDENIKVYNLENRSEIGTLFLHQGGITAFDFHDKFMFSAAEDGVIAIWKKKGWICAHTLKGHTGPVLDISVHSSGRLLLSIGKDKTLRLWNLLTARCVHRTKLQETASRVKWMPTGDSYLLIFTNNVNVYSAEDGTEIASLQHPRRVHDFAFVEFEKRRYVLTSCDDGIIYVWDLASKSLVKDLNFHTARVKGVVSGKEVIAGISTDGSLSIWETSSVFQEEQPQPICSERIADVRFTCLELCRNSAKLQPRLKAEIDEEEIEAIEPPRKRRKKDSYVVIEEPEGDRQTETLFEVEESTKKNTKKVGHGQKNSGKKKKKEFEVETKEKKNNKKRQAIKTDVGRMEDKTEVRVDTEKRLKSKKKKEEGDGRKKELKNEKPTDGRAVGGKKTDKSKKRNCKEK